MAFRTTPQLGPALDTVYEGLPYWDTHLGVGRASDADNSASYKLGNKELGSDGAEYYWVKASANIASGGATGTQLAAPAFPAWTVATGSGGYYAPPGIAITAGDYFHARKGAYNAVPTT